MQAHVDRDVQYRPLARAAPAVSLMVLPLGEPVSSTDYRAAVAAWAEHLRGGGTEPWDGVHGWHGPVAGHGHAADAVQLAVLLRLNLLLAGDTMLSGVVGTTAREHLADLVLSTARPGRGPVDVPLPWPEASPYGSPARGPDEVPVELLLSLAAAVLLRMLQGVAAPPPQPSPTPWRSPVAQVHGPPATAALVRGALPRRRAFAAPLQLVVAMPFDLAMAEVWGTRVRRGSWSTWSEHWRRRLAGSGRLPVVADPAALAARAGQRRARGGLRIVAGATRHDVATAAGELLGTAVDLGPAEWDDLTTHDVLRGVNAASRSRVPAGEQAALLPPLLTALAEDAVPPRPTAPAAWSDRCGRVAQELADSIASRGYPGAGDPRVVAEVVPAHDRALHPEVTLDRSLRAAARLAAAAVPAPDDTMKGARRR